MRVSFCSLSLVIDRSHEYCDANHICRRAARHRSAIVSINFQGGSRPFASLEAEFKMACDAAIDACRRLSPPYRPTVWIGMIANLGAAEAARRLVVSGD